MRTTTIASVAFATLSATAFTIAPTAVAAQTMTAGFGARQLLYDNDGTVITGWTVSNISPSSDVIPYTPVGRLYEANSTVEADQGAVTPLVGNLNARASDGETYRALFGVAAPQGINPATLPQGTQSTGKIYFDVTGANPDSVVYNDGTQDLLIWVGGAANPAPAAPAPAAPASPAPAAPAPAPGAPPTPTPAPTTTATPAPLPAASASNPSGFAPAGSTGQSSASQGSMPSGTSPAGGTSSTSGISAGSAGAGGNPAGKT
jgi:Domain of unknown function (DUF1942)